MDDNRVCRTGSFWSSIYYSMDHFRKTWREHYPSVFLVLQHRWFHGSINVRHSSSGPRIHRRSKSRLDYLCTEPSPYRQEKESPCRGRDRKMSGWKIRVLGVFLMIVGGFLFVWSVRDIQSEWPQIFVGLLSVLSTAMGFALTIMPLDISENNQE